MVEGGGFEPPKAEPSDLQSDPFGHSGTPPEKSKSPMLHRAFLIRCLDMSRYALTWAFLLFIKEDKNHTTIGATFHSKLN